MQLVKTKATRSGRDSAGRQNSSAIDLLRNRSFRLLWVGEAISLVGDQFYLIALPWLVLQLTGDALAMGTVLALAGVPRALFMLIGGALTDRFSPRKVMLASNLLRMGLVVLLTGLIAGNLIQIWMLYLMALAFGFIDAFFYPAQSAIVPRLVAGEKLQLANAWLQGTMQLSLFVGPVLAGILISVLGSGQGSEDTRGITLAFAFDALTFLASAVTLWRLRDGEQNSTQQDAAPSESLWSAIGAGLRTAWNDATLRAFFVLIALSNFLIVGPISVGIPVLADTRFAEGAAAFGIIMSASGGGLLLGTLLSGMLPRPRAGNMGLILGFLWSGLGIGVLALGLISNTPAAAATVFAMGIAQGYVVILFITWLQRRTGPTMMGRMMSLIMFASTGLQPISNLTTGALISLNAQTLFLASGGLMVVMVLFFMLNPAVRAMEESPVGQTPGPAPAASWGEASSL